MPVTLESAGVQNAHRAAPSKRLKHRKPFIGLTTERWANFNANRKKARRFVSGAKWRFVEQQDLKRQLKIRQSVKTAFAANSAVALYQIRPARRSEMFERRVGARSLWCEPGLDSKRSRVYTMYTQGILRSVYYTRCIRFNNAVTELWLPRLWMAFVCSNTFNGTCKHWNPVKAQEKCKSENWKKSELPG